MSAGFSRDELVTGRERCLSRGGWGNPDVWLVRCDGGFAVMKDYAPRSAPVRWLLGRWLLGRELRAYRALAELPAVPRVLARVDALAFVLEHRPGRVLGRGLAGEVPPDFLDELADAVAAMHARGVVHLDLRHRSNILLGDDGHPVLLDFASAACWRPGGWAARRLLPWLARLDRRALGKWRDRLG